MNAKLWVFRDINPSQRAILVQALSIAPATASLLLARGVTTPDQATAWMSHQLSHDPFLIPDMEQAAQTSAPMCRIDCVKVMDSMPVRSSGCMMRGFPCS